MKLRSNLLLFAAACVVPLLLLVAGVGYYLVAHMQDALLQSALDRNRAFMTAVDTEVRVHATTLNALGTARSLASRDFAKFRDDAERALKSQPAWLGVVLFSADGRQIINTSTRDATHSPIADAERVREVAARASPGAGDIVVDEESGLYGIPVRVPVLDGGGKVAYVLAARVSLNEFSRLLKEQNVPNDWVAGLTDRNGRFIARLPPQAPLDRASPAWLNAVAASAEGWYRGRTLEGIDMFTAHKTSALTGWSGGFAMPVSVVYGAAFNAARAIVAGAVASLLFAAFLAFWIGRRIGGPLQALASVAERLPRNVPIPDDARESNIAEVQVLARAVEEAGRATREREMLLEREQKALKSADEAKNQFLAMVGHELRNPLAAIQASAFVLKKSDEHTRAELTDVIQRQTANMTRLVEDLLDLSRLAMGKITLRTERFELSELVAAAVRSWTQAAGVPPNRVMLTRSPVWMEGDKARIEQIVLNLLTNANKFSAPSTQIRVRVAQRGEKALLEVADEGDGIAPEMLEKIFEPFVQGAEQVARSHGGLGIGLSVVKRLVEMHSGTVSVRSAGPGKGASFTVTFDCAPEKSVESDPILRTSQAAPASILLVDDNDDARKAMQKALELAGHRVLAAPDAEAALRVASERGVEAAVIDIALPGMDGYELARRLRHNPSTAAIALVALTAYGQPADERRAYEAGFNGHLTKPATAENVSELVSRFRGEQAAAADAVARTPQPASYAP